MRDPAAFRSGHLPTDHFDRRFSADNVAFWVPLIVEAARIEAGSRVLDVGCGTGGFSHAIAAATAARVVGYELSEPFLERARSLPPPPRGSVEWVAGDAEALPFPDGSFDRVLLSLVLHQLRRPQAALAEARRVLDADGVVLVRTIAPEDVADRVPERYLPAMAAADAARLPSVATVETWLSEAGFGAARTTRRLRNKELRVDEQADELLTEARFRYPFIGCAELDEAVRLMRADAARAAGRWIDPRPTYLVAAACYSP